MNRRTKMNPAIRWLKCLACRIGAPRFHEDMPADKPGEFAARCTTQSLFGPLIIRSERHVSGLRDAYIEARWLALRYDCIVELRDPARETNVYWEVTRIDRGLL